MIFYWKVPMLLMWCMQACISNVYSLFYFSGILAPICICAVLYFFEISMSIWTVIAAICSRNRNFGQSHCFLLSLHSTAPKIFSYSFHVKFGWENHVHFFDHLINIQSNQNLDDIINFFKDDLSAWTDLVTN